MGRNIKEIEKDHEILRHLANGDSISDVAEKMRLSKDATYKRMTRLARDWGCRSYFQLMVMACRQEIIKLAELRINVHV